MFAGQEIHPQILGSELTCPIPHDAENKGEYPDDN
jgi:hypothetical protein